MNDMDLESVLKDALQSIKSFRTPDCPESTAIGRFIDKKLDPVRTAAIEEHLQGCLYCLKQLNDMTEMLHYGRHPEPLSPRLRQRLREALHLHPALPLSSVWERVRAQFLDTPRLWRYATIGLATAWGISLMLTARTPSPELQSAGPNFPHDAFVKVQTFNGAGTIIREQQGVVVDREGLIAANLSPLAGAARIRITFRDGSSREIDRIWKDDNRNLAVMKTDSRNLTAIPLGDISEIVGKRVYAVSGSGQADGGLQEAVASDIRELGGRQREGGTRYLQVATQTTTETKGAVLDDKGRLLGFLITEEKHLNLATPVDDVKKLAEHGAGIPVSELKTTEFSGDAVSIYMKGLLANEGHRWDQAIGHFTRALQLNKRLEGAYVELGYAYFRKHDYEREGAAYREALKLNPDDSDALYSLAWNLESRGRYGEAIPLYEKALKFAPDDTELLYQLGLSYLAQGKKDKAVEICGQLEKFDKGQAGLLLRLIK